MTPVVNTPTSPRRRSTLFRTMRASPGPTFCAAVILALFVYAFVVPLFSVNPFEFEGMSVMDSLRHLPGCRTAIRFFLLEPTIKVAIS